MIGNSNDGTNFLHKLLLTATQISRLLKAFAYGSSANIKLSKTHLSKMIQLGGFLTNLLYAISQDFSRSRNMSRKMRNISKKCSTIID